MWWSLRVMVMVGCGIKEVEGEMMLLVELLLCESRMLRCDMVLLSNMIILLLVNLAFTFFQNYKE